jgi:NADH-quinone oxidoreductase subunit C
VIADAVESESFGLRVLDVRPGDWRAAAAALREDPSYACDFFDWLSAYDDGDAGLAVCCHVASLAHRDHLLLRTHVDADAPHLASLTAVWRGADWGERETYEMYGVVFDGHPDLRPLLLPDDFDGHPLRKDFALAARDVKAWPGESGP